jgi:hypothetical protein
MTMIGVSPAVAMPSALHFAVAPSRDYPSLNRTTSEASLPYRYSSGLKRSDYATI